MSINDNQKLKKVCDDELPIEETDDQEEFIGEDTKEIEEELAKPVEKEEPPPEEPPSPEWQEVKKRFAPNPSPKSASMNQIRLHWFDTTTDTHITTSFHRPLRHCTSS